jgi:hypothetical protein
VQYLSSVKSKGRPFTVRYSPHIKLWRQDHEERHDIPKQLLNGLAEIEMIKYQMLIVPFALLRSPKLSRNIAMQYTNK